jgi:hypothetical protein
MMRIVPGIFVTPASVEAVASELELAPPPLEELLLEPVMPASCRAPESAPASLVEWAPPLLAELLLPLPLPGEVVAEPSPVEEPDEALVADPGPVGALPASWEVPAEDEHAHTRAATAVHPAERKKCMSGSCIASEPG